MSSDQAYLALRLQGPLQSWGFDSQYNRRNTGLMPSKSAIAGMCCAAFGYSRGSDMEHAFLEHFRMVKMTAIAIPRRGIRKELPVRRLQDYHTVQNTRRASGTINKDCVLTHRQYLTDASFGILLEGNVGLLEKIAERLVDPVWGLWLGRKCCIPTSPIFEGLRVERQDALALLIDTKPLEMYTHQEEASEFSEGRDSIPDMAVSFASANRQFSPRRVITRQSKRDSLAV